MLAAIAKYVTVRVRDGYSAKVNLLAEGYISIKKYEPKKPFPSKKKN